MRDFENDLTKIISYELLLKQDSWIAGFFVKLMKMNGKRDSIPHCLVLCVEAIYFYYT